jgi:osmoprotectant transport system permease protein
VPRRRAWADASLLEIGVALLREGGDAEVSHIAGLGGTAVTFRALEEGSIDLYPEYTGTVVEAILHGEGASDIASLCRALEPRGIGVTRSLGFNNTYAIAVPRALAEQKHLRRLSDLARAPELRLGLSHEFLGRSDAMRRRWWTSTARSNSTG